MRDGESIPPRTPHSHSHSHTAGHNNNNLQDEHLNELALADDNILGISPFVGIEP